MPREPDSSPQTVAVLRAFRSDPTRYRYGYDIAQEIGLMSGTLYPILARLADRGYLERRWEDGPRTGKPPRQLYRLTDAGQELAARLAAKPAQNHTARRALSPKWEGAA
ncbi:PadR family transcriptional regulator [Catellatospora aurea]|uniref:PadR family transcriptional regulator n=1 Tax=Catellatospora aurea TaxID=1337874 RepID=A0ABW2H848_9ACTN